MWVGLSIFSLFIGFDFPAIAQPRSPEAPIHATAASAVPSVSVAPLVFEERVLAGGPADFMEVRHLVLRGSNYEIGRKLAEIARTRHGTTLAPGADPAHTRAQREYFAKHYPALYERMRGAADAYGLRFTEDTLNFSALDYGFGSPGCTVAYFPPALTADGRGVVSRNFDFTTGVMRGKRPGPGETAVCARPYVIEMHPDQGYASLYVGCFDLLGAAIDGINAEGLTVALLADDEVAGEYKTGPTRGPRAGFNEIQLPRYLLDTCANVEEAKAALRDAALYFSAVPCHYLIADRHGRAFVWENTLAMKSGHIADCDGRRPLITTNFMLYRHPDLENLPAEPHPRGSFNRFRHIRRRVTENANKLSAEFVRETGRCVAADVDCGTAEFAPGRTLWHTLYFPEQRRMEVDFYLGEGPPAAKEPVRSSENPPSGGAASPRIRRSAVLSFTLKP